MYSLGVWQTSLPRFRESTTGDKTIPNCQRLATSILDRVQNKTLKSCDYLKPFFWFKINGRHVEDMAYNR